MMRISNYAEFSASSTCTTEVTDPLVTGVGDERLADGSFQHSKLKRLADDSFQHFKPKKDWSNGKWKYVHPAQRRRAATKHRNARATEPHIQADPIIEEEQFEVDISEEQARDAQLLTARRLAIQRDLMYLDDDIDYGDSFSAFETCFTPGVPPAQPNSEAFDIVGDVSYEDIVHYESTIVYDDVTDTLEVSDNYTALMADISDSESGVASSPDPTNMTNQLVNIPEDHDGSCSHNIRTINKLLNHKVNTANLQDINTRKNTYKDIKIREKRYQTSNFIEDYDYLRALKFKTFYQDDKCTLTSRVLKLILKRKVLCKGTLIYSHPSLFNKQIRNRKIAMGGRLITTNMLPRYYRSPEKLKQLSSRGLISVADDVLYTDEETVFLLPTKHRFMSYYLVNTFFSMDHIMKLYNNMINVSSRVPTNQVFNMDDNNNLDHYISSHYICYRPDG